MLRPSAAGRWVPCPGSFAMESRYPEEEDSLPAKEGQAAHWVAAEGLQHMAQRSPKDLGCYLGAQAPNGVIITEEMVLAAQAYLLDVATISGGVDKDATLFIEHPVDISTVHPMNRGTLDGAAYCIRKDGDTLTLWDFKFGWGIVSVYENWQLLDYALGVLQERETQGRPLPQMVQLRVFQPRPYHPEGCARSWTLSLQELHGYLLRVRASAEQATKEGAPCNTGPHCDNCKSRHACPALRRAGYRHREMVENPLPDELSGDALGREVALLREAATLIENRLAGVEALALAEIKSGRPVPGWVADATLGNRKWSGSREQVIEFGDLVGVDLSEPGAKSPAGAERAGVSKDLVNSYTERKPGALKLWPCNENLANEVFFK